MSKEKGNCRLTQIDSDKARVETLAAVLENLSVYISVNVWLE
jgi:hypothetical protein